MAVAPRTSMAERRAAGRRGWTLLEVCTVLILLAVVASRAVPGLQLLRESSRRNQCQSHMAGIGLALQTYHQAHGLLPPAVLREGGGERFDLSIWHAIHSNETRELPIPEARISTEPALRPSPPAPMPKHEPQTDSPPTITNSIGIRLVLLPSGAFLMGLADTGEDTGDPVTGVPPESPPHEVRLTSSCYFSAFEVTEAQYEYVMGKNPSWHAKGGGGEGQVYGQDTSNYPVEQVAWTDAAAFCRGFSELPEEQTAGRRLPLADGGRVGVCLPRRQHGSMCGAPQP